MNKKLSAALVFAVSATFSVSAFAADTDCTGLPTNATLLAALKAVVAASAGGTNASANYQNIGSTNGSINGGFDYPMWSTVVNKYGRVCAVVTSGTAAQRAWPASRVIAAQKASTANSLSSDAGAISTAFLFAATQPGAPLFGLQHSNPVNTIVAYRGDATT